MRAPIEVERLTAALLDRLTHYAYILELVGKSFRFRQRMLENKKPEGGQPLGLQLPDP